MSARLKVQTEPATPAAGYIVVWTAADGLTYSKDETGAVRFASDPQGSTLEGYSIVVVDETLSGLAAISTDLSQDMPIGSVLLCVQGNIETLVVAGGTSVKVGIGPVATPSKYGLTSAFTKNLKIDTIPVHAVLAGAEDVQVNMCATGGGIGDTVASAGAVRVRIVYAVPISLVDAA